MTTQQRIKQVKDKNKSKENSQEVLFGAYVDKILLVHLRNVYGIVPWSYQHIKPSELAKQMEKVGST